MSDCYLYRLPNEACALLLHLFTPIPTPDLLPLTAISRRIYNLILRILHNRLVAASELHDHSLLLECYHPSARLTEPPYFCAYRGTDGLTHYDGAGSSECDVGRLGEMHNMYSRFQPHRRDLEAGGRRVVARPGDIPGSRTFPGTVQEKGYGDTVKQTLSLESHELFTQLVAQTNLVKIGPRSGLFTCFVDVEEGVLRVWRDWLNDTAAKAQSHRMTTIQRSNEATGKGKAVADETVEGKLDIYDPRILWVSSARNTGLLFNVRERKLRRDAPILIRNDEDMPVSYEIEYVELVIRTSHLLFTLEKAMVQEDNSSGQAVVFGPFG
ncbi:hypothetical protein T440DRAFT_457129 [Plenodomus tracheiphilus IPT5]|uniref:Uncharacterized protein n=1 Tax=Plenodomus tracheiphilus IPT5 TaxID=1408161 RepID=A0A6A7AV85_9PLEO|nr:hypothetical protein T440DRAFT_457129 [Plenodomus tracheiphilus IPT5]